MQLPLFRQTSSIRGGNFLALWYRSNLMTARGTGEKP